MLEGQTAMVGCSLLVHGLKISQCIGDLVAWPKFFQKIVFVAHSASCEDDFELCLCPSAHPTSNPHL